MNWYLEVLSKYAVFSGRARRKEYWFFILFNAIFAIAAMILDYRLGFTIEDLGYGPLYLVYALATLIPGLAVTVRRLHDVGKSGWYFLFGFIPLVGGLILLYFAIMPGDPGHNEYGPDPIDDDI